ncbi:MAG TPA: hypothetical protein VF668_00590 [Pyrinomonadaceae bacterium]|jgi:hypothetical protein
MYKEVDLLERLLTSVRSRLEAPITSAFHTPLQYVSPAESAHAAEVSAARVRANAISSYAQPTSLSELLNRSGECLSELRGIVEANLDKVSSQDKQALDDLDRAGEFIKRAAGNGPGGDGPPPPDDPWWKKFFKTVKAFCEQLASLAATIARKVYQVAKGPVATAWSAFWQGAAPTIITIIICALGGPCDPGAFGG